MGTRRLLAAAALLAVTMSAQKARAIAQSTGDFELEMDAPWRMEPRAGGYGAIPIQISIHDADQPATGYDLVLQHLIAESQQGAGIADVVFSFVFEVEADVLDGLGDLLAAFLGVHLLPSFDGFTHVVQLDQFVSLTV